MRRRLLAAFLLAAVGLLGSLIYVLAGLPSRSEVRALAERDPGPTSLMRQREAEARARGRNLRSVQVSISLQQVSRSLIQAVIASEDQKFFGHDGVDWNAIQESVEANVKTGRTLRGGSTITQQLAKNLFFDTHRSLTRKARELIVAWWLERDLPKVRILALYLNVIEWGDGIYGCEAAARAYYGKSAADLLPIEAAGLVAMIPNPRRINPTVSPARFARAQKRVLWLMATAGYIEREVAGLGTEPPPEVPEEMPEEAQGEMPEAAPRVIPEEGPPLAPEPEPLSPDSRRPPQR
jgi:monofunctional biosynthetic peptidoglycan transglycosylase